MTRKGSGAVIILLKKRTVAFVFGAVFLAAAASGFLFIRQEKQALSPKNIKEQRVIVLDAGHGGEDGGAVSAAGVPESNINLAIAQKTQLLFIFTGQTAIMTREGEEAIYSPEAQTLREKKVSDLNNRVKLVNETHGSFLISIHQNSLPGSKVKGAQVFYKIDEEKSKSLADIVQAELNGGKECERDYTALAGDYYVLNEADCAAILCECGFLSNAEDEKLLLTDEYRTEIAEKIFNGIEKYRFSLVDK